jgi:hypothetical protein
MPLWSFKYEKSIKYVFDSFFSLNERSFSFFTIQNNRNPSKHSGFIFIQFQSHVCLILNCEERNPEKKAVLTRFNEQETN